MADESSVEALIITADRLWDGTGSSTRQRPMMRVVDGKIAEVKESLLTPATCQGTRVDFPGCTILPGLIDTHVHLVLTPLDTNEAIIKKMTAQSDDERLETALHNARLALHAGITTVRDCGGTGEIIRRVRDSIRAGKHEGADVLTCGSPITTTLGHCHWMGLVADSHEEVRAAAQRMLDQDADFLKVMATGGNMTPTSDPMKAQYDDATLALIADMGRQAGKHSAAHVLSRAAMPGVVAAQYRTIEHCDWRIEENKYGFDPELARKIVDQNQFVGLTMSGTTRRAFIPELMVNPIPPVKRLDIRFECERRMLDFGIRFTLHSDAGVRMTPIESFSVGLRTAEVEHKLTPAEILRAVTSTAAEAIGLQDRGELSAGKRADFIVVEGDPLRDLTALDRIRAIMKAGKWVEIKTKA